MNIAKELLKKEEQYTEIQQQLNADTRKILGEYTKYKEQKDAPKTTFNKNSAKIPEIHTTILKNGLDTPKIIEKETKDDKDVLPKTSYFLIRNFQEQIASLKNELSAMKTAHKGRIEEFSLLKSSKEKLSNDVIKLNSQNNSLRNNLKEKEVLCTEQIRKLESTTLENQQLRKELEKVRSELHSTLNSGNLQRDQMLRTKKSCDNMQQFLKKLERDHRDEMEHCRSQMKSFTKRIQSQEKLIDELVSGIGQQQSYIDNLKRQCDLLAMSRLSEATENEFRQLLNLYVPDDNSA